MSRGWKYGSFLSDDKEIRYLSSSTLMSSDPGTTEGCLRKFHYEKVMGLKPPQTPQQAAGVELHAQNELYLDTGDKSGFGPLALAGQFMLPKPKTEDPRILIEHDIAGGDLETAPLRARGIPIVGYIDLIHWQDTGEENRVDPTGTVEVLDWKTSSDPKWIKTPKEMASTLQMTTYGKWAVEVKKAEWVRLSHGYYFTKGRHAPRKVSLRVHRDEINERWEYVEKLAGSLVDVVKETNPDNVPANTRACGAYRGCPHASYCSAAQHNSIAAFVGDDLARIAMGIQPTTVQTLPTLSLNIQGTPLMNLLDQLKASQKPISKESEMERLLTEEMNAKYPGAIDAILKLEALGMGMLTLTGDAAKVYCLAKKLPLSDKVNGSGELEAYPMSDGHQIVQVYEEVASLAKKRAEPEVAPVAAPVAEVPPVSLDPFPADAPVSPASPPDEEEKVVVTDAASAMQVAAEEPKKTRGRKKKTEEPVTNVPAESALEAAMHAQVVESLAQPTPNAMTQPLEDTKSTVINLFVDCAVAGRELKSFWDVVNRVTDAIAQKYGGVDYRCCANDTDAGFGKWKGHLAAGLRGMVRAGQIKGDYAFDNVMSETGSVVLETMRELVAQSGGIFVRGVR